MSSCRHPYAPPTCDLPRRSLHNARASTSDPSAHPSQSSSSSSAQDLPSRTRTRPIHGSKFTMPMKAGWTETCKVLVHFSCKFNSDMVTVMPLFPELLGQLQIVLDESHPSDFRIWPQPICWKTNQEREENTVHFPNLNFSQTSTLDEWLEADTDDGPQYHVAIMATTQVNRADISLEEWRKSLWHMWIVISAHPPRGLTGRTIITWDPDTEPFHNTSSLDVALGFELSWINHIRSSHPSCAEERVWQNIPNPSMVPGAGWCLRNCLLFLHSLINNGLTSTHANKTLQMLPGFVQLWE
ncbi:hypothetical protein FB451DRAFT_1449419 [Mycena latifolia]|nr:hypothetical protein FB451DRAFT_1449419 [Mycena latifolia]